MTDEEQTTEVETTVTTETGTEPADTPPEAPQVEQQLSQTVETHKVVDDPAEEKNVDSPDAVETTVTTEVQESDNG